jgi:hypothetical protein
MIDLLAVMIILPRNPQPEQLGGINAKDGC